MRCLSFFINKHILGNKLCVGTCLKVPYGSYAPAVAHIIQTKSITYLRLLYKNTLIWLIYSKTILQYIIIV